MRSTLWHGVLPKARIRLREGQSGRRMPSKFASSFSVAFWFCVSEYMSNLCQNICHIYVRIDVEFMSEYMPTSWASNLHLQSFAEQHLLSTYWVLVYLPSLFFWASFICPPSVRWIYDNKCQNDDEAKKFLDGWMHPSLQTDEHTGMGWARKSACGCLDNRGLILWWWCGMFFDNGW